ncbi:MAG: membrane protease YdiL (CAAX protease family), partial [Planctomycetota bacterium]
GRGPAHLVADLCAILFSSVAFAAFHLEVFTRWLGVGGEVYDGPTFLWRLLAGVLFAGLYRWRGLGVVAWAHGLFNLAVLLGADPSVFRGSF